MCENYYTRGFCLIITNRKFGDATKNGNGSEIDAEQLEKLFRGVLLFTVRVERDLRRDQMLDLAIQFSRQDLSRYGAFVFIIMSHGSERTPVCGVDDESIEIGLLTSQFTATKCPSLKNKPKLFFIQTYSGKLEEPLSPNRRDASSVAICDLSDSTLSRPTIPNEADFLLSFAIAPGYKNAWPFPGFGSPFIRVGTFFPHISYFSIVVENQITGTSFSSFQIILHASGSSLPIPWFKSYLGSHKQAILLISLSFLPYRANKFRYRRSV